MKYDGSNYYKCILLHTENMPVIIENKEYVVMEQIEKYFELKEDSIGPPEIYVGRRLCKVKPENSVKSRAFGSTQYIRAVI